MNESIRKLMVEAGMQFRLDSTSAQIENEIASFEELYVYDNFDPQKFAELIVKRIIDNVECHASLFNTKEARQVCSWIVKSVKYDFGVEE